MKAAASEFGLYVLVAASAVALVWFLLWFLGLST